MRAVTNRTMRAVTMVFDIFQKYWFSRYTDVFKCYHFSLFYSQAVLLLPPSVVKGLIIPTGYARYTPLKHLHPVVNCPQIRHCNKSSYEFFQKFVLNIFSQSYMCISVDHLIFFKGFDDQIYYGLWYK